MVVPNGYFFLNLLTGWKVLEAEYTGIKAPDWVKPLIYIAIPWAFSIHTVTAFIYSGIPGRDFLADRAYRAEIPCFGVCDRPGPLDFDQPGPATTHRF